MVASPQERWLALSLESASHLLEVPGTFGLARLESGSAFEEGHTHAAVNEANWSRGVAVWHSADGSRRRFTGPTGADAESCHPGASGAAGRGSGSRRKAAARRRP